MMEPAAGIAGNGARNTQEIEREIEHTRDELAETIAALAEKANIKERAGERVRSAMERAKPYAIGAVALLAAAAAVAIVTRRRKRGNKLSRWLDARLRALP